MCRSILPPQAKTSFQANILPLFLTCSIEHALSTNSSGQFAIYKLKNRQAETQGKLFESYIPLDSVQPVLTLKFVQNYHYYYK